MPGSDRPEILRRDAPRREVANDRSMLGAIALVASTGHPADGVTLTWAAAAILATTGVVAVALASVLLSAIDLSAWSAPRPPLDVRASGWTSKPSPPSITATLGRRMPVREA